eukprot:763389-Hanusia_phi.AAC.1
MLGEIGFGRSSTPDLQTEKVGGGDRGRDEEVRRWGRGERERRRGGKGEGERGRGREGGRERGGEEGRTCAETVPG